MRARTRIKPITTANAPTAVMGDSDAPWECVSRDFSSPERCVAPMVWVSRGFPSLCARASSFQALWEAVRADSVGRGIVSRPSTDGKRGAIGRGLVLAAAGNRSSARDCASTRPATTTTIPALSMSRPIVDLEHWCDNFGHPHAEVVIEHQDLAACHQTSVYEDVDWVASQLVERNDRPRFQLQDLFDQELCPPELDPQI